MITSRLQNLPMFLVVGAAKSGTTSLHHYLNQHPDVFLPARKELLFWHQNRNENKAIFNYWDRKCIPLTIDEYLEWFNTKKPSQTAGEVCPSYLYYHRETISSLQEMHPRWKEIKIVIILRDPLERIKSEYRFVKKHMLDPDNLDFQSSISKENERKQNNQYLLDLHYLSVSMYHDQVAAYLNCFKNTKVLLFDDLVEAPRETVKQIFEFLGLSAKPAEHIDFSEKTNVTGAILKPKSPVAKLAARAAGKVLSRLPMKYQAKAKNILKRTFLAPEKIHFDEASLEYLRSRLVDDVKRLSTLINRDLSHWLNK